MLFFDIRGTQSPHTLPYRCLALFVGFLLIKVQKVFLILIALSQDICCSLQSLGAIALKTKKL